ncbi:hypothetical protein F183_A03390 [Bryobacterales bacterium F-183]|nr:hypothetical protein F183_A03390 [Bryobacterales bacterium F-183]
MKKQAPAEVQYAIRGVPADVDQALRKKAAHKKQSPNRLIPEDLSAVTREDRPKVDFSDVVGGWVPDPAFDETIASQRQIDHRKWK